MGSIEPQSLAPSVGNRLEPVELPYQPERGVPGEIPPALGNWTNFLQVGQLIIVPCFGVEEDRTAVKVLGELLPKLVVKGLDCRELAEEGGLLNCMTWQVSSP